jgi:Transglycosylase SLT domain
VAGSEVEGVRLTKIAARVAAAAFALLAAVVVAVQPQPAGAAAARQARPSLALADAASHAFDRALFTSSPGGILPTAARVTRWHGAVVRAARGSGFSPGLLEAIVLVESSGHPDAIGGAAAGLTQLQPATARRLRLRVKLERSEELTRRIGRAVGARHARQLQRWRSRYDQRFAPARELRATVRYLESARRVLGRADLAVASYHLGVRELERAIAAYDGEATPSYAQLYFGSTPARHAGVWRRLRPSADYYWKVLAAERVLRLYRRGPSTLRYEASLQARKNSAEEVLHPRHRTARFASPAAIARALHRRALLPIPPSIARTHLTLSRQIGQEAHAFGRSRRLYAALRPATLDVLLLIGHEVHSLSGARSLIVTSAVRDLRYQRLLMHVNANAARTYSIHTTGYAFDIARTYSSGRQAAAFQFVLDRLTAVGAIAYIREATAIHVAVASDAPRKLALLARS